MPRRRTVITAALGAALGAVAAGCTRAEVGAPAPGGGYAVGLATEETFPADRREPTPPIAGELLDGTPFDLAGWAGRVVVLNWWGSWCAPCRLEAKDLQAAYVATRELGVEFLGINIRDERDKAAAFTEDFGITYPSLFDPAGRVALEFRAVPPTVVPTTLLLDRQHRSAAVFRRVVQQEELEAAVRALAGEDKDS